jgi:hypothetical protein
MAFDSKGDLFVVSYGNNCIYKITPGGVGTNFASGLSHPYGLAINSADHVFEADDFSTTLNEFTPSGAKSTFGFGLLNVYNCLACDNADNLFVGEYGTGTGYDGSIVKITPDGVQSTFASGLYAPMALAFGVPEPSSLALLVVGGSALLILLPRFRTRKT